VTNLIPSWDDRAVTWLPVSWSRGQPEHSLPQVEYKSAHVRPVSSVVGEPRVAWTRGASVSLAAF